jgi:hypothetical protein
MDILIIRVGIFYNKNKDEMIFNIFISFWINKKQFLFILKKGRGAQQQSLKSLSQEYFPCAGQSRIIILTRFLVGELASNNSL